MKKVFNKIRRKKEEPQQGGRITNDTLAEHRARILAGGRRFKYPVQYQRHKLVFNAIIIGVATVLLLVLVTWWQLYIVQNTSDFMYRVTRVVPVPIASIEGEQVRYSDYLMKYRGAMHCLVEKERVNLATEDGQRQSDFVKNESMDDAIADAYAAKLARENGVTVSDVEVEELLKKQLADGDVSEESYSATINDFYGWSMEEYRDILKAKILRQKVAFAIDRSAEDLSKSVGDRIEGGATDLQAVADAINGDDEPQVAYAALGWLPRNNQDDGLTAAAADLEDGQISAAIRSTNGAGYYYVKLIDSNDTQVNYEYIQIPLTQFDQALADAEESADAVVRYIELPEVAMQPQQQQ